MGEAYIYAFFPANSFTQPLYSKKMDETILLWVNGQYNEYLDAFMPIMTHRFAWIAMYIAIAIAVFRTLGRDKTLLFLLAVALTIVLADQIGASMIRPAVARLRPSNIDNPLSSFIHIVNGYRGGAYGMPSCHAANTVGLLTILTMRFRSRLLVYVLALWVAMQVYSRMYLGVHYPSDLLVGGILGTLCATAAYYIYVYAHKRIYGIRPERVEMQSVSIPIGVFFATLLAISVAAKFLA